MKNRAGVVESSRIKKFYLLEFVTPIVLYYCHYSFKKVSYLRVLNKYIHTYISMFRALRPHFMKSTPHESHFRVSSIQKFTELFFVSFQDLNGQFNSIRKQVSDLHRDVTTRRCLTSYKKVENIVLECTTLTDQLEKTDQLMQERKSLFQRMWEEEQQRITTEQAIFKEQVNLNRLAHWQHAAFRFQGQWFSKELKDCFFF